MMDDRAFMINCGQVHALWSRKIRGRGGKTIPENRVVTISDLATRVPEVSKSLLHKIEGVKIDGKDDLRSEVGRWLKTETAHFYEEGLCRSLRHGMTNS